MRYRQSGQSEQSLNRVLFSGLVSLLVVALLGGGLIGWRINRASLRPTTEPVLKAATSDERRQLQQALDSAGLQTSFSAEVKLGWQSTSRTQVLGRYLLVTAFESPRQQLELNELPQLEVLFDSSIPAPRQRTLAGLLKIDVPVTAVSPPTLDQVLVIPAQKLSPRYKLLAVGGDYFLADPRKGAIVSRLQSAQPAIRQLKFEDDISSQKVLSLTMTGVTALTRGLQTKLTTVGDPNYFSQQIGQLLASADFTHISNEISFLPNCSLSQTSFCAPPPFIETLKSSGVDLVELTGNHNNDRGAAANAASIKQYQSLGWQTFGGGLNAVEAARPARVEAKRSKLTLLGYNSYDPPHSLAIAGPNSAGANSFSFEKVKADIAAAKKTADVVIVNVQYRECYAYPDGAVEYPICDAPIDGQRADFQRIADLGADIVIGSSAHQPQSYELYKGKPIYYGLGNLYFDQIWWPGTTRSLVLTHYFQAGRLLQTRLTPTIYDASLQTRPMNKAEASKFLGRLAGAR